MSVTSEHSAAAAPDVPAPDRCPRCGATLAPDQDWCLRCGTAARTRLAPTPNWRAPIVAIAVAILLALVVLAWAFIALTRDGTPQPAPAPAPQQQPATTG